MITAKNFALSIMTLAGAVFFSLPAAAADTCKAQKDDVAGCQPSPFNAPIGDMPSRRVNAHGLIDAKASDEDVRRGASLLEKRLDLFRNFTHVHWLPATPSVVDKVTGVKSRGSLDGDGDGRALTISGRCLFGGHKNDTRVIPVAERDELSGRRPLDVYRIQDDPVKNAPVRVGGIPTPLVGYDDTMLSATTITGADGKDQIILVRDMDKVVGKGDGHMYVYTIDPRDCSLQATSDVVVFGSDFHEPSAWFDPKNPKRMLIVASTFSQDIQALMGLEPGPSNAALGYPDLRVFAVTDENTGEMLQQPTDLARFRLQDVGGPVTDERPDATGLFSDGRFVDWSDVKSPTGAAINPPRAQGNSIHQATMSIDGERIYVAGGSAGFYILNSASLATHSNAEIAANAAGCNRDSTNIYVGNVIGSRIDAAKLPLVANDCIHMVINDDPGVKAVIAAGRFGSYLSLLDRSRWDPFPPRSLNTGIHSAIAVPDRPSLDKRNHGRPSMVLVSEERFDCPFGSLFIIQTDAEATPQVLGTFALPVNTMEHCLKTPTTEPNGEKRHFAGYFSHDPTVFKNLVFSTWMGQGLRAIDISNPANPREVGHAVPLPSGESRSYPVYKDGLFYWMDIHTGIHVARYSGPRADELPHDNLVYEGNAPPHR